MDNWEEYLNTFVPSEKLRHEEAAIRALWMAITASQLGTYGVGAVLFDEEGEVQGVTSKKVPTPSPPS